MPYGYDMWPFSYAGYKFGLSGTHYRREKKAFTSCLSHPLQINGKSFLTVLIFNF